MISVLKDFINVYVISHMYAIKEYILNASRFRHNLFILLHDIIVVDVHVYTLVGLQHLCFVLFF